MFKVGDRVIVRGVYTARIHSRKELAGKTLIYRVIGPELDTWVEDTDISLLA